MLTDTHLDEAMKRGIITAAQRDALVALALPSSPPDLPSRPSVAGGIDGGRDENIRLIGGGNDLFVTVGIILLGSGLLFALNTVFVGQIVLVAGSLAIAAWACAEFVTRQHRMRLASTVLALMFVAACATLITQFITDRFAIGTISSPAQLAGLRPVASQATLVGFGGMLAVCAAHFWRFRVPILAAVTALCLTAMAFIFTALFAYDSVVEGRVALPPLDTLGGVVANALYMPLVCGLVIFGVAVLLDLADRERETIWSDCAFWLHVISAPLLVHPLFILATGQDVVVGTIEPTRSASIMLGILIAGFVLVALAIDRRSLLVPTLAYFGTLGIYFLVNSAANSTGIPPFAIILMVIGLLIMVFGAGWQRIRRLIIAPLLPTSVLDRLPPIRS